MRHRLALATCLALAIAAAATAQPRAEPARSTYQDAVNGVSIEPPRFAVAPKGQATTIATFMAPGVDGFANNVNIVVEPFTGTFDEYKAATLGQLKAANLTLISQKETMVGGRKALLTEFRGAPVADKDLRFLTAVVLDETRAVVVTCTADPARYDADFATFRACIDTLRIR